jgi:hypothetical protein
MKIKKPVHAFRKRVRAFFIQGRHSEGSFFSAGYFLRCLKRFLLNDRLRGAINRGINIILPANHPAPLHTFQNFKSSPVLILVR